MRNGAPVTRYHRSRDPHSTAGHGRWGVPPTPRHWPRPPVLAAHQTCPRSSPLRISRPGSSVVRPATCGATHGTLEEHCRCPYRSPFHPPQGPRGHCLYRCASPIHSCFHCPTASPQFDAPCFTGHFTLGLLGIGRLIHSPFSSYVAIAFSWHASSVVFCLCRFCATRQSSVLSACCGICMQCVELSQSALIKLASHAQSTKISVRGACRTLSERHQGTLQIACNRPCGLPATKLHPNPVWRTLIGFQLDSTTCSQRVCAKRLYR